MAFLEARAGDFDKLRLLVEVGDGFTAAVAHPGADAADQLVNGIRKSAFERDAALNPFGHQLLVVLLEIAILEPLAIAPRLPIPR